jgi:hypothetical protein
MSENIKRMIAPLRSAAVGKAIAITMLSAVAACGGGSDDGTAGGTQISAVSKAVPDDKGKPGLPDAASDVARGAKKLNLVVNSTNPAMQKLARLQCLKRARISPGVNKVHYPAASTTDLKEDNCAVILAVQPE